MNCGRGKEFVPLIPIKEREEFIPLPKYLENNPPLNLKKSFKPLMEFYLNYRPSWKQLKEDLRRSQLEETSKRIEVLQIFMAEIQRQIEDEKRQREAIVAAWLHDLLARPTVPWKDSHRIIPYPLKEMPKISKKRYPEGPSIIDPLESYL